MNKPIKTESEYETALVAVEELMACDPDDGTPEADHLELLTLLVQDYESRVSPVEPLDPVDAIEFRMDQMGYSQRDLIPYIGSRSKVSEVLSRKRSLTLPMIRALHEGLGIPLKALVHESNAPALEQAEIDWDRFPLREMIKRGWVRAPVTHTVPAEVLSQFLSPLGSAPTVLALYRKSVHIRSARTTDQHALFAWTARVMARAQEQRVPDYVPGTVNVTFVRELLRRSQAETGPQQAMEFLQQSGIALVVEPHLPRTHLDGAAILGLAGNPVIGLTLRYDRIDNFWFCLVHELAHVALHLEGEQTSFYDDLDADSQNDIQEEEADRWAGETLIPNEDWEKSPASRLRSPEAVQDLADSLGIHPAIVAGRMRFVYKNYRLLNHLVGLGQVRRQFPEVHWSG